MDLASGFIHDGEFISRWLHVSADATPIQGLFPLADDLAEFPEPPPTSAVYVGRLEPDTAIRIYVEGIQELVTQHRRPMTFHVFGDGSLAPQLRAQAADQRLPIEFHGAVPDAQNQIPNYCFAFVDGRMAIQEAMARRRAVIAAYSNPLRRDYVCGESFSPFLVPVADASQLAVEVMQLIDQAPRRQALVQRAFSYAQTLSWDATAQEFLALWKARLTGSTPPLAIRDRWTVMYALSRGVFDRIPTLSGGNPSLAAMPQPEIRTS